jgi:methyl-accepting chemotaxis protein
MHDTLLLIFVVLTFAAIAIQAGILFGLYVTAKKSSERMEGVLKQIESRALPLLDQARAILDDTAPKLQIITANLAETSATVRAQAQRMDMALSDVVDRTRLQIIRVDEMLSRTLNTIDKTTAVVQHVTVAPITKVTGMLQGLSAAIGFYLNRKGRPNPDNISNREEELFI